MQVEHGTMKADEPMPSSAPQRPAIPIPPTTDTRHMNGHATLPAYASTSSPAVDNGAPAWPAELMQACRLDMACGRCALHLAGLHAIWRGCHASPVCARICVYAKLILLMLAAEVLKGLLQPAMTAAVAGDQNATRLASSALDALGQLEGNAPGALRSTLSEVSLVFVRLHACDVCIGSMPLKDTRQHHVQVCCPLYFLQAVTTVVIMHANSHRRLCTSHELHEPFTGSTSTGRGCINT